MSKRKKTKYLVDTSAVPVALGESTGAHCEHFAQQVGDGVLYTSIYIRKEFIHRWVRYYIEMAFTVDHFSDVPSALFHLNQAFGVRDIKTENHAIAVLLQQKGAINNCRSAAEEIGRLAVGELKRFDRLFRSRTPNSCGCRIGGEELKVDYNQLFEDLRRFTSSVGVVSDCPINQFLGLTNHGIAPQLLEVVDVPKTRAGAELARLHEQEKWITCIECAKIGDAVIALEQPKSVCLVHIDHDFKILCTATNRENKPIKAERAIENPGSAGSS